jgi:adenylate cyclase
LREATPPVAGLANPVDLIASAGADVYERALDAYRAQRFEEALGLLRSRDGDPPSRVLAERCERFLSMPPPPDWDGIWVAREK